MTKSPADTFFSVHDKAGVTATLFFIIITGTFVLLATTFPQLYILATYEDLPGEWAQFFFFLITLIICLKLTRKPHPHRIFFGLLALACFYVVGEEISWGQRLFSFTTPDFFQQHNLQQEINLHNFLTGPVATNQKKLIEIVLILGLLTYGLVYPLLHHKDNKLAHAIHANGLPVPPLYLSPYFIVAALCEGRLLSFNEAEIAELLIGMALTFLALHYHAKLHISQQQKTANNNLALAMISVTLLSIACAGGISYYSWQTPSLHKNMEKRISSGQKKFAKRYIRVKQYHHGETLSKRALTKQPKNTDMLRQLALCYAKQGKEELSQNTLQKAIHVDMRRYGRNPIQVSTNLSLFKSYHQAGNEQQSQIHLKKALTISHDKATLESYNANAIYWYGKALQAHGYHASAQREFAKAVALKPESKKYKRAYRQNQTKTVDHLTSVKTTKTLFDLY